MPRDTANLYDIGPYILTYARTTSIASLSSQHTFDDRYVIILLVVSTYALFVSTLGWYGGKGWKERGGMGNCTLPLLEAKLRL